MSLSPSVIVREMRRDDYAAVRALWETTESIGLNESDEEPAIAAFLGRNAGLSPVALTVEGVVVGAMLCGHDGRRGYVHHLAVARELRGRGIARRLIDFALDGLRQAGIPKVNLFVFLDSGTARAFWEHHGFRQPEWQPLQRRILGTDGSRC